MQSLTKQNNTIHRRCGALSAVLMLCAGTAMAQQQAAAPAPLLKQADSNGIVLAPAGVKTAAPAVAAPPAPMGLAVQAPANSFTPVITPSTPPSKEQAETSKDDASHQGIHVHGHWVIDVHNPDGTLAEHRDFQNSLVGASDMVGLLYGNLVPADFVIYLLSSTTPPCSVTPGRSCDIVHNIAVLPASAICQASYDYCVSGLTVTPTFVGGPSLVLSGSLTATQAGTVSTVGTYIGLCGSVSATPTTVSAASCAAGNSPYGYGALTQTGITPINVSSGQVVSVTVTITFS